MRRDGAARVDDSAWGTEGFRDIQRSEDPRSSDARFREPERRVEDRRDEGVIFSSKLVK